MDQQGQVSPSALAKTAALGGRACDSVDNCCLPTVAVVRDFIESRVIVSVAMLAQLAEGRHPRIGMDGRHSALAKMGLAVVACHTALATLGGTGGGAVSQAFVFLTYAALLAFIWHFLRSFAART